MIPSISSVTKQKTNKFCSLLRNPELYYVLGMYDVGFIHNIEEGCVILFHVSMSLWPFKKHVLLKASSRRGENALEVGRGGGQCRRKLCKNIGLK